MGKCQTVCKKRQKIGDISEEEWLEHFKTVFAVDNVDVEEDADVTFEQIIDGGDMNDDILNKNISPEEVIEAILKLKGNKAAGPDGFIPEIFKHSCKSITPFLVLLFNNIFSSGEYLEAWTEALIHPLHKKGSVHNPDN